LASATLHSDWPPNLPGGAVELVAEGEEALVEDLLQRIASHMTGYITNADIQDVEPQGYKGFRIRY
jgi:acylphosphatase